MDHKLVDLNMLVALHPNKDIFELFKKQREII